jgi:pre-mRNA-processing factor 17
LATWSLPPCPDKYFAAQSLDNQILVYSTDNFRQNRKKRFAGHSVAGYACQVGFSPDGKWISSGDGEGNVVFWDWKTGRIKSRLKAHNKVVIAHEWLPHETVCAVLSDNQDQWLKYAPPSA